MATDSQELETVSINSSESRSYGTLKLPFKLNTIRQLTKFDVLILFFVSWNVYSSRKIPFPFSRQLASVYNVSLETFSYLLAAYDLGGFCSIFIAPFQIFDNIQINHALSFLMFSICICYFVLSFSKLFIFFFIFRMIIGCISTLIQAHQRSILTTFLKNNDQKNKQQQIEFSTSVTATECGWWSSTISWVFVGIILHRLCIEYVWYYIACCALLAAFLCYLLPRCTLSQIMKIRNKGHKNQQNEGENVENVIEAHTYFCFLTIFCLSMAYNAYLACFGAWMTQKFDLNPEKLGVCTLVITCSECFGFVLVGCLQKSKIKNVNIAICATFGVLMMVICWVIVLKMEVFTEVIIWMIVFLYTVCFEGAYISILVTNLELAPKGKESQVALLYGVVSRGCAVCGIVIGPKIVQWFGFYKLLQSILVVQCCACLCVCITKWLWTHYNDKKTTNFLA